MAYGFQSLAVTLEPTPIDATSTGSTQISGDVSGSGQHFVPLRAIVETVDVDAVTETAIISIGTNSPVFDNVLPAHAIKPVAGAVEMIPLWASQVITANPLKVRVIRAATGTDLTFVAGIECLNYSYT